jgi:hypothetical protein
MSTDEIEAGAPFEDDDALGEAPVEQKSRWEDYLDVFFAPADLFRRRGNDTLAAPLITVLLLSTAFYYIMLPAQKMLLTASMPPEAQAQMPESMLTIMPLLTGIAVPITYLVTIFIAAVLLWALARMVDRKPDFKQMMVLTTYAAFIPLLGQIAGSVAIMIHGQAGLEPMRHASFGVLRFIDPKSVPGWSLGLLARIDIFKIWQAVIWAIGFSVITQSSRAKGAIVAGAAWLLFALPGMLGGGVAAKAGVQPPAAQ